MIANPNDQWLRSRVSMAFVLALLAGSAFYIRQTVLDSNTSSLWWAVLAVLVAVAMWLVTVWILIQIWEKRMLKTSLYNVELDQLIMSEARERLNRS